ncbi:hypothetical protein EF294_07400 [Gordonia oryzae]|uniref:Uncharacterized protein n=1 Tax=Gordonia oryzae TaxID=2487349 RepID=A0A3N4H254_9ACTN|nr:hypothetical protein [Gordonia oryzae]RPA64900.1 hypothetical protein EF294_07400 [Gordonia oryzae]
MTDSFDPHNPPSEFFVTGPDGVPESHIQLGALQADATRLMYQLAASAGDDDATDAVANTWVSQHDPQYFGYLAAAALSLMVRCILAPTLDAVAAAGVDLRPGLRRAAADAEAGLGGGHA